MSTRLNVVTDTPIQPVGPAVRPRPRPINRRFHHPFLGRRLGPLLWQVLLDGPSLAYLIDHRVQGAVVFPGAGYVEAGLAIQRTLEGLGAGSLEDLRFHDALVLGEQDRPPLELEYRPADGSYRVYSRSAEARVLHASGRLGPPPDQKPADLDLAGIHRRCDVRDAEALYDQMARQGLQYGPHFRTIRHIRAGREEVLARLAVVMGNNHHCLHPALLDGCFQSLLACPALADDTIGLYLPVRIQGVHLHRRPGRALWCHGKLDGRRRGMLQGSFTLCDDDGRVLVEVKGLRCLGLKGANPLA